MRTRKLGWTDVELSAIGLGTWAIGGGDWDFAWGPQDDELSIATIHKAFDLGINWLDTAPVYGLGHSEEVVGKALKGMHEKPFVATKCTRVWGEDRILFGSLKRESILREADESLQRLGVDCIDLYQIHWPDPEEDLEEGWRALETLIQNGKIRYAGVSNFSVKQLETVGSIHRIASLQPPYSMLRREIEDEILPYCGEQQIGVIPYSTMGRGLLTGKVTPEWVANLAEDDHRRRSENFQEPELGRNMRIAAGITGIARESGHTPAQLAIAWTLHRPQVTAPIVGARSPSQIEETAPAGDWELSEAEIAAVEKLLAEA